MRNLELKAQYDNPQKAVSKAESLGLNPQWTRTQVDTYFNVPRGKLKLRQVDGQAAELIAYHRPDVANAKLSDYLLFPTTNGTALNHVLAHVLNVDVVVRKVRTLYLWENVRIHIDKVEGLGNFIEFEAVLGKDDEEAQSQQHVNFLCTHFDIAADDLVNVGYYELLKSRNAHA